jgi:hypothetical protein
MEDLIDFMESVLALTESIAILAVAPKYGAGELSSQSLKRVADLAAILCEKTIAKMDQLNSKTMGELP